jgi:glyoxylase-like metal-dependent hydrolase (beta-lactamase superfamily II)
MLIKNLQLGEIETNCYIVTDEATLQCAVIDPGAESNVVMDYIESNKLDVRAILLTHGHFDHTMAVEEVHESTGAAVFINSKDAYTGDIENPYKFKATDYTKYYGEGDVITVGGLEFTVLETPGHSAGSVTLKCQDALFTGDTLFRDSCGRTDLPGGEMKKLLHSLARLSKLEGNFEVYPGHGDSSMLDNERRFNYYIRYALEEEE